MLGAQVGVRCRNVLLAHACCGSKACNALIERKSAGWAPKAEMPRATVAALRFAGGSWFKARGIAEALAVGGLRRSLERRQRRVQRLEPGQSLARRHRLGKSHLGPVGGGA